MEFSQIFKRVLLAILIVVFSPILNYCYSVPLKNPIISQPVYLDSNNGNDKHDGLTPKTAWKSLEKINSVTFGPGAKILLRAECMWIGQLYPKGSGNKAKPIIIDKYSEGSKPLINGNGMIGEGVVRLFNQQYWEIMNLEIMNSSDTEGDRRGVEIKASDFGLVNHIHLNNLDVHDITGISGNDLKSKTTAGIYISTIEDSKIPTRFDDILIERCTIYNVDNQGIVLNNETAHNDYPGSTEWHRRKFTNVFIRNNIIHNISKNAIIIRLTEGGIIERNLCYETALKTTGNTIFSRGVLGTIFQYNEGYLNRSYDYDGSLYDPDLSSPETIWQYSYSHDNAHGLVWFCTTEADTDIIVRNNISRNDKGSLIYFNYAFSSAAVYNNIFYIDSVLSPIIIRENKLNNHNYSFFNNIIHNYSSHSTYSFAEDGKGIQQRNIKENIFNGFQPLTLPVKHIR